MATFNVLSTNHTSFTVSNLDRTTAFFSQCLGFEVTSKAPRDPAVISAITGVADAGVQIAYVRGAGHSVELIEYTGPANRGKIDSRPCDTGFAHLAYDVDDVDAAVAGASEYGFEVLGAIVAIDKGPNAGKKVVYLRDEDGVTIEFIQAKA